MSAFMTNPDNFDFIAETAALIIAPLFDDDPQLAERVCDEARAILKRRVFAPCIFVVELPRSDGFVVGSCEAGAILDAVREVTRGAKLPFAFTLLADPGHPIRGVYA